MKLHLLSFLFLFLSQMTSGQDAKTPAIKIYLSDAETKRNITKAKVTLEGFEKEPMEAKYNKDEKYYYYTDIPYGYTTVMAYHKSYNEKGYQNPGGLPNTLHLNLSTPYRLKFSGDSLGYYKEDASKIVIRFAQKFEDSVTKDFEPDTISIKNYIKQHYPGLDLKIKKEYGLGLGNFYYATKTNKKSFERFNDPIIKKLSEDTNIKSLNGLLLKTVVNYPQYKIHKEYFDESGKSNYIPKYIQQYNNGKLVLDYALKKSQLDSLYKIEEKKYRKNEFYEFEATGDTLVQKFSNGPFMPTYEFHSIPYALISDLINRESKPKKKEPNVLYSFTYRFVTHEEQKKDLSSESNLVKVDTYPINYKPKHLICSPFGLVDVLEVDTESPYILKQEFIGRIYK